MSERALRVLVADDERMARRRLVRELRAMEGVEVVAECASGGEVLSRLEEVDVDVALLDIHMPGMSGLEVSKAAAEWGVEVIFATAHPEHAAEAFDRGVVDYVLKPIEPERLAKAIERARQRLAAPTRTTTTVASVDRLAFTVRGEVRLVAPLDISHAIVEGQLVAVWVGQEKLLTDLSLMELESRLPAGPFERVHRRALVNLDRIARLHPLSTGGYTAITVEGHEVPVSRQSARRLRKRLGIG
jgi:two-component system LytT family response regulator